jgi:hypothetical protein
MEFLARIYLEMVQQHARKNGRHIQLVRSQQFGVVHAAKIYSGRTQCVKFLKIILFRSMPKVSRARH